MKLYVITYRNARTRQCVRSLSCFMLCGCLPWSIVVRLGESNFCIWAVLDYRIFISICQLWVHQCTKSEINIDCFITAQTWELIFCTLSTRSQELAVQQHHYNPVVTEKLSLKSSHMLYLQIWMCETEIKILHEFYFLLLRIQKYFLLKR